MASSIPVPRENPAPSVSDECWVSEYHADINAVVNISDRHDPWGESLPLKPAGGDISRDEEKREPVPRLPAGKQRIPARRTLDR